MTVAVGIEGSQSSQRVMVSRNGELAVAPLKYDDSVFKELATINTGVNFYAPSPVQQFVITGMRIKANRDVSNTVDAEIIIYEAATSDTTTVDKILHQEALVRGEGADLFPLHILVSEGKFINAKTDDNSIFITILGYYIEAT